MRFSESDTPHEDELLTLYESVGWRAYTDDPTRLKAAVKNSDYVATARDGGDLVGLVRGVTDEVSILLVQDLLVHPDRQRRGVGTKLLNLCLEALPQVPRVVLLTDSDPHVHRFYESVGFQQLDVRQDSLRGFVRIRQS